MRRVIALALSAAVLTVAAAAPAAPQAVAAKRCAKGMALLKSKGKSRCVKRCPQSHARKRKAGRLVCVRRPTERTAPPGTGEPTPSPAPDGQAPPAPAPDDDVIRGEEAKTILHALLHRQLFKGSNSTGGSGGSFAGGRDEYGFCRSRYGYYSSSSASTEFGTVTNEKNEGGPWVIAEAVAAKSRREAAGRLTLTPDGGSPREIVVEINADGPDRLDGIVMNNEPFDCSGVPGE